MANIEIEKLGPLASLLGVWEGDKGNDVAPDDNRGTETNLYRERIVFDFLGPINNHEQELFGLKYATTAWRLSEPDSFHEELGYWLWDAREKQVLRCFLIPRGISVIAGGTVEPGAKSFSLSATLGSATYGICSNLFLDREFKTVRYDLTVAIKDSNCFSYEENTQLLMKGNPKIFNHRDQNTLKRVS